MHVLVTGGAGYIGSHAALRLLLDGRRVTVVDDLSTGNQSAVDVLVGAGAFTFVQGDVRDEGLLTKALRGIDLVMHFAAKTNVGESVADPAGYWSNNVAGSVALIRAMDASGVKKIVFSSSCAVYGEPPPTEIPIGESCPQSPVSPYGQTKLVMERLLSDRCGAGDGFASIALRYFNVAGADRESRLGELHDPETHLIPICLQCAAGLRESVKILGDDYDTPDGTCIRDYVHVEDLVDAHIRAMEGFHANEAQAFNVGTSNAHSVMEVVEACRAVTGREIPTVMVERRAGDPPVLRADASKIKAQLGWAAPDRGLEETVASAWWWMQKSMKAHNGVGSDSKDS